MDERTEVERESGQPTDPARRTLLRHGVKLVYVVPVVLAALKATPASAQVPSRGALGVMSRKSHEVPADVLAWLREIESEPVLAG